MALLNIVVEISNHLEAAANNYLLISAAGGKALKSARPRIHSATSRKTFWTANRHLSSSRSREIPA